MTRWGMAIDLRKCFGCRSCARVCHEVNRVPRNTWRRVDDCGLSGPPARERKFLPLNCNQCSTPPCLEVCPTKATHRHPDGIIDIDPQRCIGCGYCIIACPYRARTIITRNEHWTTAADLPGEGKEASEGSRVGVCTKCHFCLPRIAEGLARGLKPGIDADATPTCVATCSANALYFGDLDDPESDISRLLRANKSTQLQKNLETSPAVYYIVPENWAGPGGWEEE